ncbi:MAG: hypothetical protein LAP87_22885 [Acidobacteriia bacterium]|nr:hypothetical protein [Terriglobia bacterium]
MDDKRRLLQHFLAALAYRTQKALRGAPPEFASFRAASQVRTPHELIRHMDSVLGYARTFFIGGSYRPPELPDFGAEVAHFHETLAGVARHLEAGTEYRGITAETLLQGPFADAMTHAGQLAMLRRLAGSPVPPENFIYAEVDRANLGPEQPLPARPDEEWPERG